MKRPYCHPAISREVSFRTESPVLQASVVDNIPNVESTGQTVVEYDFTDDSFNHAWGD